MEVVPGVVLGQPDDGKEGAGDLKRHIFSFLKFSSAGFKFTR